MPVRIYVNDCLRMYVRIIYVRKYPTLPVRAPPTPVHPLPCSLSSPQTAPAVLTSDPQHDQPLQLGWVRSPHLLPVLSHGRDDVGGGADEEEEEDAEGGAVVEELHEGAPQQLSDAAAREDEVVEGHEGQQEDEADAGEELHEAVAFPPPWQALVPDGCQQLLAVWVGHKLRPWSVSQSINPLINQSIG